ncbi:hypothetical protein [Microbacterium sp. CFBP9034]|uniref:hypothetical protein n=1 Tax=Microbacterium sp. CFBP9034 TaxID=3096540 RepID=UPI002A6B66B3|nr:hypothetical protein [Microbacterium sp. CFBP9034]MDY0909477.1 hypothetical protein [Microbacterium sp. CFBP9034]
MAEATKSVPPPSSTRVDPAPTPEPIDLGFGAEEEQVTGSWLMGWVPPFPDGDERFEESVSDDQPPVREIFDTENGCSILMEVSGLTQEEVPENDRVISDTILARSVVESPSSADIDTMGAVATDDALWQEDETATMDFRVWHGASEEGTVVLAARGFGEMAAGLLLGVLCPPGGDAVTEYREFVDDHARIMVRWPEDE